MGIKLDIAANTRAAVKSVEDVGGALEKVADEMDDLGRDGARDVGRFEDALRDAQNQAKKTEKAVDDIGTGGRQSFDKVKGGAKELQQEIGQNLGESVASFRGDMSDLGQVGQDTLGGLAATLAGAGPAGLVGAAGLAAAAIGVGGVVGAMQEAAEKQAELEEAAAGWAEAYVDASGRIVDSAHIVAEVQAIASDPERYKQAAENAKNWGVDTSTAMLAMSGDATALEVATAALNERQLEWGEIMKETHTGSAQSYDKTTMTEQQRKFGDQVRKGSEALNTQQRAMDMGQKQARNAARALYEYASQAGTATGETDDLGNAIVRLPDGKEIVVDAETKQAHTNIDAVEQKKLTEKIVDVDADTSRARNKINALNGITVGINVGANIASGVPFG